MKYTILLLLFSCALFGQTRKEKNSFDYCTTTIKQGLYGCCTKKTGACELPRDTNRCKWRGVKRIIYIYEATTMKQANSHAHWCDQINTKLVAQTESDDNGCFQIELPVGEYSIFVFEDGKYYFTSMSNNFIINWVIIDSNKVTKRGVMIKIASD